MTRDLNQEYQDTTDKKYAYDFDYILRQYMMKTFDPFFNLQGNTLEMGCFVGEFTKILAKKFKTLDVIEGSSDLIEVAKKKVSPSVHFICSSFESFKSEKKYDNIFLSHTLEHLDDPVGILQKIKGWLTENGRLFLVVPNANAPSRQIAVYMNKVEFNHAVTPAEFEHGHRMTYSLDTLERVARKSGITIESRGGVFFKPFANFQFDKMIAAGLIDQAYLDGCFDMGFRYPDLCASVYLVCKR